MSKPSTEANLCPLGTSCPRDRERTDPGQPHPPPVDWLRETEKLQKKLNARGAFEKVLDGERLIGVYVISSGKPVFLWESVEQE